MKNNVKSGKIIKIETLVIQLLKLRGMPRSHTGYVPAPAFNPLPLTGP